MIHKNFPHFPCISTCSYTPTVYMVIFVNRVLYVDGRPVLVRVHSHIDNVTTNHFLDFSRDHYHVFFAKRCEPFCPNPFCPRFNKGFTNKSRQTCHFITSPVCFQKKLALLPLPRGSHGIPLPNEGQLRRTYEDTDVIFTSNKCALCPLA